MSKKNSFFYLTTVTILILGVFSGSNNLSAEDKNETEKIINQLNTLEAKVDENEKTTIALFSIRKNDLKQNRELINVLKKENEEVKSQIIELISQVKLIGENFKEILNAQSSRTIWIAGMGIGSAILGALIGGWFTGKYSLKAIDESHQKELIRIDLSQKMRVKGFLQAIYSEIDTVWKLYEKSIGGFERVDSLVAGKPILMIIPLTHESYFNIYDAHTSILGQIKDDILRDAIVKCYGQGRGLIDTIKMNNSLIEKYQNRCELSAQFDTEECRRLESNSFEGLSNYSEMVLKYHYDTKVEVENLMPLLLERIESNIF
jgi:hypothetical protein